MGIENMFSRLLGPQDRLWRMKQSIGDALAFDETPYYIESVDEDAGMVHVLTWNGHRLQVPFDEIVDVQKTDLVLTMLVNVDLWRLGRGDPAYLGRPIPVLGLHYDPEGQVTGFVVSKWPMRQPNQVLYTYWGVQECGLSEQELKARLPSFGFNIQIGGNPESERNRRYRIARARAQKLYKAYLGYPRTSIDVR